MQSLYHNTMNNPDDRPSFLAGLAVPLAILVTVGVVLFQLFLGMVFLYKKGMSHSTADATVLVGIYPALVHLVVAVLYHRFKGMPADKVVNFLLHSVWTVSVIGGAIYCRSI